MNFRALLLTILLASCGGAALAAGDFTDGYFGALSIGGRPYIFEVSWIAGGVAAANTALAAINAIRIQKRHRSHTYASRGSGTRCSTVRPLVFGEERCGESLLVGR